MANMYSSQKTGLNVIRGTVKEMSEDRKKLKVTVKVWDTEKKEEVEKDFETTVMSIPVDDKIKAGYDVTIVGYKQGQNVINPSAVMNGNDYQEVEGFAFVTGFVSFARLNEEKNEDGSPKTKQDGSPRKPHFDICVSVLENGNYVSHIVSIYDTPNDKEAIKRAQRTFKGFDKDSNKITVSIVTGPGDYSSYEDKRNPGVIRHQCKHLGFRMLSVNYLNQKERTNDAPQQTQAQPAPQAQAPAQSQPQPQPVASGFTAPDLSADSGEVEFS